MSDTASVPLYEPYDPVNPLMGNGGVDDSALATRTPAYPRVRIRVQTADSPSGWKNYELPRAKLTMTFLRTEYPQRELRHPDCKYFAVHYGPAPPSQCNTFHYALVSSNLQLRRAVEAPPADGEIIWIFPSNINRWLVVLCTCVILLGILCIGLLVLTVFTDSMLLFFAAVVATSILIPVTTACCHCACKKHRVVAGHASDEWADMEGTIHIV